MSLAVAFSGQGSQYVGMGDGVLDSFPVAQRTWEEADEALGDSISGLVRAGPSETLTLTENAQPAILAYSVALLRVLQSERPDFVPTMAAGHSLGEYSALVCAGALDFPDALRLVRARGRAMQAAVPPGQGGMVAVAGLSPEVVQELCGDQLDVAAINSPVQAVVAGPLSCLSDFEERAMAKGARRCVFLKVSAPFHSRMLRGAEAPLRQALSTVALQPPRIPVFQNVTAAANSDLAAIRENLVAQVSRTVRWSDCVFSMKEAGATSFVELGPGRTLAGLIKKCDRSLKVRFTDRSGFLEQF